MPTEPTPRRVLIVEFFSRGGLIHYTLQLARAMAAETDAAEIVMLTAKRPEAPAPAGVHYLNRLSTWNPHRQPRWLPRRLVRVARGLIYVWVWMQVLRAVRQQHPRLVLLRDLEHRCDGWFVRRLHRWCRRQQPPVVLADVWDNVEPFERYRGRRVLRRLHWRLGLAAAFDAVFVHGAALSAQFADLTGRRACTIPHGNQDWIAEQAGPDPRLDECLHLPPGPPLAMLFGALSTYKGVEILLAAMAALEPAQRPLLLIAGMPTAVSQVGPWQRMAREHNLEPWLRWDLRYVPTPDIAWYFRRADWVVLPYRRASQSGVGHLALTFGKPLLVTATGGLPELIEGNGIVVPPEDAFALAHAMARLARSPELRRRWGQRSAELARSHHAWGPIARTVLRATVPDLLSPAAIATKAVSAPASEKARGGIRARGRMRGGVRTPPL
ncbi:MAG: glycosyltransferase [Terriglobales bacterium]